jgi:hypothetical protein
MAARLSALHASLPLSPGKFLVLISVKRLSRPQGHSAAGRIWSIEKSSDLIWNRTHDLLACNLVPQPTMLHICTPYWTALETLVSLYVLEKHKPWFDEECSKLLHQRKQAKLQWLQNPTEINGDNLNNIWFETSGHFRNKKGTSERQYWWSCNEQ